MINLVKQLYTCALALIISTFAHANGIEIIEYELLWNDIHLEKNASTPISLFENSSYELTFGNTPCIVHKVPLTSNGQISGIQWITTESANLPSSLLKEMDAAPIQNNWQVNAKITDGRGKPYLVVSILPIRRVSAEDYERLLSFRLEISWVSSNSSISNRDLTFTSQSALSEGSWFKIAIGKDGVYKLDKNVFNQLGLTLSDLTPSHINVYGNGGEMLPEENSLARRDDLTKCAIYFQGEDDGIFNDGDYILFYGKGPDSWRISENATLGRNAWEHEKHYYSDSAYYFIRIDDIDPLRLQSANTTSANPDYQCTQFQDYQFQENDTYNIGQSGREFFGDVFDVNTSATYSFNFPNILTAVPASVETVVAVRSVGGPSNFSIQCAGQTVQTGNVTTSEGALANVAGLSYQAFNFSPTSPNIACSYNFNKYSNIAEVKGYIDYIRVNVTRSLTMSGNQMRFRDTTLAGTNQIVQYRMGNPGGLFQIWDISDYTIPKRVDYQISGDIASWSVVADQLHEYIGFGNSGFLVPQAKGPVINQNLHGMPQTQFIIVTAPDHLSAANELAEIHQALGTSTRVVTQQEIFNEFSSGNPDVTAIRMLMKMLYDRAQGDPSLMPENLLLFGDGDYSKNKGLASFEGANVMLFESTQSLSPAVSYVSDDYYVFLSDDDDESYTNLLDAGVGRIPATDASESSSFVDKIKAYIASNTTNSGGAACIGDEEQSPFGPWRNILTFISDDQDGSGSAVEQIHLEDADSLSALMRIHHPEYDLVKIYMDAYTQESTPGGERYLEGEQAIRNRVENGSLIVTYLGHGGERGWAHERILDINTISSWTNKYRLPVFLTATCELARYDNPGFNSAGELLVMNPNGGAIAMLTTTRVVFAGSNMQVDLSFFDVALEDQLYSNLTLGMINMMTKNGVNPSNSSKPNFSLLGDPALRLVYPKMHVYTTHINGVEIGALTDTLKALEEVEFRGYLGDEEGNKLTSFNGFIYPTVFDKMTHVYTQNNDYDGESGVVQEYDVFNKNIFKGKASVASGDFTFKFVVPYDINYTVGPGRVSYYGVAGDLDAHGFCEAFNIGSSLSSVQLNSVGPEIELYLNDTTFVQGGVSNTSPILLARLKDENGINTVGNGIGHDLIAVLDNNTQNPIILNEYYQTDLDTYKSGEVRYQLGDLSAGNHTLQLKAWDVHNNSSTTSLDFVVSESADIALEHVLNYPNPFTTQTQFMFEHNQACNMLEVKIQIFTISGKLVKTITTEAMQSGFRAEPIPWDGTDDFGDRIGKGVYVYKLSVRNEVGETAEKFEKLVILK